MNKHENKKYAIISAEKGGTPIILYFYYEENTVYGFILFNRYIRLSIKIKFHKFQ